MRGSKYQVGDVLRVIEESDDFAFPIGTEVKVIEPHVVKCVWVEGRFGGFEKPLKQKINPKHLKKVLL